MRYAVVMLSNSFMRLLVLILCVAASSLKAGDWYVAQSQTGSGSGADQSNCKALSWFNSSANWNNSAGTVMPGDTVWLEGTFTNAAIFYGQGTQASPITIRFDTGAKFVGPFWPAGAISKGGSAANVIIDGGINGLIIATNNGSSLGFKTNSFGVYATYMSGLEMRNLTVLNQYVPQPGDSNEKGYAFDIGAQGNTNISVHNCIVSNAFLGINCFYIGGGNFNINFYSNRMSGCSVGVNVGQGSAGATLDTLNIWANRLDGCAIWDGNWTPPPGDGHHHQDSIHVFANVGSAQITDLKIYRNLLGPNMGTNATAWCYLEGVISADVYNNVFLSRSFSPDVAFLDFKLATPPMTNAWRAFNNSFAGLGGGGNAMYFSGGTNICVANNAAFMPLTFFYLDSGAQIASSDRNVCFQPGFNWARLTNGTMVSLSSWIASSGMDQHSLTNNPLWNPPTDPEALSPMIGAGSNLWFCFSNDFSGSNRSPTGAWDIGAYMYISNRQNVLAPPQKLSVVPQ